MAAVSSPDPAVTHSAADAPVGAGDLCPSLLYLAASDGTRLHCRRWLPPRGEARATLLFLHGIASHGGWFAETAALLAARGIVAYAPDRRGSGFSFGPRGHLSSYERAAADAERFLDLTIREQPSRPLFLAGSSWAARVALAVAARRQHDLDGLILHGRTCSHASS